MIMVSVKVLGSGCTKCNKLYEEAERAIAQAGVDATLEKVSGLDDIVSYGVMLTPALVVDEVVRSSGRLPSVATITTWLTTAAMTAEK
jgi:small redox-active disulfide protein 2